MQNYSQKLDLKIDFTSKCMICLR